MDETEGMVEEGGMEVWMVVVREGGWVEGGEMEEEKTEMEYPAAVVVMVGST